MIKAVIFDFFGVLVGDGFDATYRQAGGDPEKDRQFIEDLLNQANSGQISVDDFRAKICQKLNITVNKYEEAISQAETPNQALLDFIKQLKRRYKTAILSNVNTGGLERRIERRILEEHFNVIVASADVGYMKPQSEIYNLTAGRLGVKPQECVFIDDRLGYVEAAKAVGMKAILFRNFGQMKTELVRLLSDRS